MGLELRKEVLRQNQERSCELGWCFQCPLPPSAQNCLLGYSSYIFWVILHPRSPSPPNAPSFERFSCPGASWPADRRGHPLSSALAIMAQTAFNSGKGPKAKWDVCSPRRWKGSHSTYSPLSLYGVYRAGTLKFRISLGDEG